VYKRSGFVGVKADSSVEPQAAAGASPVPVLVRIVIREGVRTLVGAVTFSGNASIDETMLRGLIGLQPGRPFIPAQLAVDRETVLLRYLNLGYENAGVDVKPEIGRDGTRADLLFTVREGRQIRVDHVLIVGNSRTSPETIERELRLHSGDPLGREAKLESQRRLSALGLFSRVDITELGHGDENCRDLLVTVQEAPMTTIAYGGGVEGRRLVVQEANGLAGDQFQLAPRASLEIGRRNLFGKNRSVTAFASGSLPLSNLGTSSETPSTNIGEYRLGGTYREPRIFDTAADAFLNVTFEQQIRSSFDFRRRSATAQIARRITRAVSLSGSYQIERTEVFNSNVDVADQLLIDRTFPKVRLSSFLTSIAHDTRNDPADTTSGHLLSADGQLAARAIGSQVGFVKGRFTAQMFRTLPKTRGIVFAASSRLGLAAGFPREVVGADGTPQTVDELDASSRFYAGGDTTIRGFPLDAVGVRHDPPQAADTIDPNGFPLGGNAVVILNGELRVPLRGGLQTAAFVDTGNVFQRVTTMDLSELRTAVGFGIRYKSPIGPIRVDLGFKVNRRPNEDLTAWFVTFGQAF
jgi:outer membrane protein assembly complex protein YaeT